MTEAVDIASREHIETRVLNEQVALMCRLTTSPLTASVVVGVMMVWLTVPDHGLAASLVWYVALLLVLLLRWRIAATYLRRSRGLAETKRWRAAMMGGAVLGGSVWSIAGSFLLPHDPTREIVMSVFFIGCTASGMGSQAPVRHAYACLLIPFVLPYIAMQLWLGGDRVVVALAFMLYIPVMLVIAGRQTRSIERQIRLAIENESLADLGLKPSDIKGAQDPKDPFPKVKHLLTLDNDFGGWDGVKDKLFGDGKDGAPVGIVTKSIEKSGKATQ